MAGASTRDGEFGLQIAPMLDILFVLLLFFMVAAGTLKHEAAIITHLPSPGVPPGPQVPIQITIAADGQVDLNGAAVDVPNSQALPQMVSRLHAMIAGNSAEPVILTPSPNARQQRVVDVLNACTVAGVKNLTFGSDS